MTVTYDQPVEEEPEQPSSPSSIGSAPGLEDADYLYRPWSLEFGHELGASIGQPFVFAQVVRLGDVTPTELLTQPLDGCIELVEDATGERRQLDDPPPLLVGVKLLEALKQEIRPRQQRVFAHTTTTLHTLLVSSDVVAAVVVEAVVIPLRPHYTTAVATEQQPRKHILAQLAAGPARILLSLKHALDALEQTLLDDRLP